MKIKKQKRKIKFSIVDVNKLGKYLIVRLVDIDESEFQLYFKIKVYLCSLIYLIIFIIFCYYDIKILNLSGEMPIHNDNYYINMDIIISILRDYMYNRIYFILPLVLFIYSYMYYKAKNWQEYKMIILRSIYRLLNLLININIVIYILDIGWYDYIEYNIIFFVMVLISIILILFKLIVLRKVDDDSFTYHFLSFPFITLSYFIFLYLLNPQLIFKWYVKILSLDEKYYLCRFVYKRDAELFGKKITN